VAKALTEASISLPGNGYDVVGSIVLYQTEPGEIEQAVKQFLSIPLRTHLCVIDKESKI